MAIDGTRYLVGIGPWRIVPNEPRHNTFHMELNRVAPFESVNLIYLGLRDMSKQDWMIQTLPNSTLRKYVAISPRNIKEISTRISAETSQFRTLFIFEGSITWFITLYFIAARTTDTTVICNFFSSGKYDDLLFSSGIKAVFFRSVFQAVSKTTGDKALMTFDTELMSTKVRSSLGLKAEPFPVPSSFDFKARKELQPTHSRVLINIRSFDVSKLHSYLESSCQGCTFIIPKGIISSGLVTHEEFGRYTNIEFDKSNIGESEYARYIDSFDYLIILYKPSINASGKILDAITRGVPVAVPREAKEWAQISRAWGKSHLFSWGNAEEESALFRHPEFASPTFHEEPPFTPRNSIKTLGQLSSQMETTFSGYSRVRRLSAYILSIVYYSICTLLNYQYSARKRLFSFVSKQTKERV